MKNKIFLVGLVALICLGFNASSNDINTVFSSSHIIFANANNKEDFVYLSDLNYEKDSYVKDGYYLRKDKNSSSGLITVNILGKPKSFIKGISAWATSEIIYDISDYDFDYFTAYLGVDAKEVSTYYNSGVTFTISTSNDGLNWEEKFKTNTLKGFDDAVLAKVLI